MSRIDQTIDIKAPIEACYKALLHFEQYPMFIPEIQSIRKKGGFNVWHWRVSTPDGGYLEWDIEIQGAKHQHHAISWRSIRDADAAHSGAMTLHAANERQTRLHLVAEYKIYATVSLSEEQVERCLERCLQTFKASVEQGFLPVEPAMAETLDKKM